MLGAAAATGATSGATSGAAVRRRIIDIHHHYAAPAFEAFNRRFVPGSQPLPWNLTAHLADMDATGVALSVLSGFSPTAGGSAEDRRALSRAVNEFGARLVQDHPGRFALFATLPIPDVDACLAEAAYASETLGAVGFTVYTDDGRRYLGDPAFDPLWSELDRRRAVVFVHPHAPDCCTGLVRGVPDTIIEFAAATSRSIASLIFSGATQRFRNIRFVFPHGGGAVPFLIERFMGGATAEIVPGTITRGGRVPLAQPPGGVLVELRRMYFDTAQIANPVSLRATKEVVGASQMLFGTDVWFRSERETYDGLALSRVFSEAELDQVCAGNALGLLPVLAKAMERR